MHRHSPGRIQKSKGIKIKHVLRICFLVAVCCWLIFQIKRPHYNKKDLNPSESTKISVSKTQNVDEVIKLGRKDLGPKEEIKRHEEEEEEDDDDDDDEHEEHEIEEDEMDENEEETVNDEDKDDQDQEGGDRNVNQALEEHYKADDASSAVTQEYEKNQTLDNSDENLEVGILEHENRVENGEKFSDSQDSTIKTHEHGASANTTAKIQEKGSNVNGLPGNPNISSKSTNNSMVVDIQTILNLNESTTKKNSSGSSKRDAEIDEGMERDEVQQDGIDSTDFSHLDDMEEDTGTE